MAITLQPETRTQGNDTLLWAGVLMGPLAWALDEGLSYSLAQHSCSTGHRYVLFVISACCIAFALAGALIARTQLASIGGGREEGGTIRDRRWWMARLGIVLGLGFSLVIIALSVPKFLLNPCD